MFLRPPRALQPGGGEGGRQRKRFRPKCPGVPGSSGRRPGLLSDEILAAGTPPARHLWQAGMGRVEGRLSPSRLAEASSDKPGRSDGSSWRLCVFASRLGIHSSGAEGSVLLMRLPPPSKVAWPWVSGPERGTPSCPHSALHGGPWVAPQDTGPVVLPFLYLRPTGHFVGCGSCGGLQSSGVCKEGEGNGQGGPPLVPCPPPQGCQHTSMGPAGNCPAVS